MRERSVNIAVKIAKIPFLAVRWVFYNMYLSLLIVCIAVVQAKNFHIYPVPDYILSLSFYGIPVSFILWKIDIVEKKIDKSGCWCKK